MRLACLIKRYYICENYRKYFKFPFSSVNYYKNLKKMSSACCLSFRYVSIWYSLRLGLFPLCLLPISLLPLCLLPFHLLSHFVYSHFIYCPISSTPISSTPILSTPISSTVPFRLLPFHLLSHFVYFHFVYSNSNLPWRQSIFQGQKLLKMSQFFGFLLFFPKLTNQKHNILVQ